MIVSKTDNQVECGVILHLTGATEAAQPIPPSKECIGITQMDEYDWLIIENKAGRITCHLITEATRAEALAYYDSLMVNYKTSRTRIAIVDMGACLGSKASPQNN
jgi:hypothetical protein